MRRMTRVQMARLPRLLWMYYSPAELSNEIGCDVGTIYRTWIPAGLPHKRDENGRIWIIGTKFTEWAIEQFKRKPHPKMPNGMAYCLRCRKPVMIVDPRLHPTNVYTEFITGCCAECGARVNRARKRNNNRRENNHGN
jgi:hypothetical protein